MMSCSLASTAEYPILFADHQCTDRTCCDLFQTNWWKIFPNRFLLVPVLTPQEPGGPIANNVKPTD